MYYQKAITTADELVTEFIDVPIKFTQIKVHNSNMICLLR